MGSFRNMYGRLGAVALIGIMLGGCTGAKATWPPVQPSASTSTSAGPLASGIHVAVPEASGAEASASAAPRATAAAAMTVDQITADYTYKDELITPLAHLYGTKLDDFVIATITNDNDTAVKVVVTSEITGYTDKATDTVTVDANGTEEIRQNPQLTTSAIDGLNSQHQADVHVVISYLDNGQPRTILDQTSQTLVTSRRDFPWSIEGFTQQENYDLVVAMITPTDPSVEQLIVDAGHLDPQNAMISGYHADNDAQGDVYQRLDDIWRAEQSDYNLTYDSTTISFASGSSQRIRLPGEVLDQSAGNCIELALLYASVVEALHMQSAIVILPGHAYVGVRLDATNDNYYFIESTMIGTAGVTFADAAKEGNTEWADTQPHIAAGDADYGWVDVPAARADGIIPIPWR